MRRKSAPALRIARKSGTAIAGPAGPSTLLFHDETFHSTEKLTSHASTEEDEERSTCTISPSLLLLC